MQIIHLDSAALDAGAAAFRQYIAATVCGPETDTYIDGMHRATGAAVIAGAIIACIQHGLVYETDIVHAVARVSRCRRSTVRTILSGLADGDPAQSLWRSEHGRYRLTPSSGSYPRAVLLAA